MSKAMGLLLRQWREEQGWSRERLVGEICSLYGSRFVDNQDNYPLPSEKTIQRGENGQTSPTVRTLSVWIGALQGIPEERLDTFFTELFGFAFSEARPPQEEGTVETFPGELDTANWANAWWRKLLDFIAKYHVIPQHIHDYFLEQHPRRRAGFFNAMAIQRVLRRREGCPQETILVVDDEFHILTTLSAALSSRYEVLIAGTGMDAIDVLQDDPERSRIGVIISDQRMPGLSGVEFLMQAREYVPHAQPIILTAFADIEVVIASINEVQANRYFLKPFDRNELIVAVDEAFQQYHAIRRNAELLQQLQRATEQVEATVARRTAALQLTNRQLQHSLDAKDRFLATIADDLCTPLRVLTTLEQRPASVEGESAPAGHGSHPMLPHVACWLEELRLWAAETPTAETAEGQLLVLLQTAYQSLAEDLRLKQQRLSFDLGAALYQTSDAPLLSTVIMTLLYRSVLLGPDRSGISVSASMQEDSLLIDIEDDRPALLPDWREEADASLPMGAAEELLSLSFREHLCRRCLQSYGGDLRIQLREPAGTQSTIVLPRSLMMPFEWPFEAGSPAGERARS